MASSDNTTIPDNGEEDMLKSGQTSPNDTQSGVSSRTRSNTATTLVSSAAWSARSFSTVAPAIAPANTPVGGSVMGMAVKGSDINDRFPGIAPPADTASVTSLQRRLEQKSAGEGVAEKTNWEDEALEMASLGLARLVQLAKDEHAADPSKSVEQYFSEHLAKVIKQAEIEFDASTLS